MIKLFSKYIRFFTVVFGLFMTIISCGQNDQPFLNPPQVINDIQGDYAPEIRAFQGIPSLAISPGGRFWATWYAGRGAGEDEKNYVVLATSGDHGKTWNEFHIIDPDGNGPVRAFDPELWVDPDGRLWSFWAQAVGHEGTIAGVWAMTKDNPDNDDRTWSQPRRLTDGIMMCKPLVLSSGEWVLPASTWKLTDNSARLIVSDDQGKNWQLRGAAHIPQEVRTFDEHMIIERKDHSLWMLIRTLYGIGESFSTDRGQSWSAVEPSALKHPPARFFISRLQSGNLLLVKHGPIDQQIKRSHLTAFVSLDDGLTWEGGLVLDQRESVSYPDGQQTADGTIYIIYDFARRDEMDILMASFRENDILSKNINSETVSLRNIVCNPEMNVNP